MRLKRVSVMLVLFCWLGALTACGGGGGNAPNNTVTAARAGLAQNVSYGRAVTLDGSQSTGANGKLITYQWSIISKPAGSYAALNDYTIVNPVLSPDMPGIYILSLVVSDGVTTSSPSTVTITVSKTNSAPVANAGTLQNVVVNQPVTLDGSKSSDSDNDLITYRWLLASSPAGSSATIQSANTVNPTFIPDKTGPYVFSLVVNDGTVDSAPSFVTIAASLPNAVPVANAGSVQNVLTGSTVTLNGSLSSDADGDLLTYSWSFTSKPDQSNATLSNYAAVNPQFTADKAGAYVLNLVVSDGKASSSSVAVTVNVSSPNAAPVANAGSTRSVIIGTVVSLDGSASSDANGDAVTYRWSFVSMPEASNAILTNVSAVSPSFLADVAGSYVLRLTVNDGKVDSAPVTVTINAAVPNAAPVAWAGDDVRVRAGKLFVLDGSKSSDADYDTLTHSWAFVSKPAGSVASLSNAVKVYPTFTPDVEGTYVISLKVNDGTVDSATAVVSITAFTDPKKFLDMFPVPMVKDSNGYLQVGSTISMQLANKSNESLVITRYVLSNGGVVIADTAGSPNITLAPNEALGLGFAIPWPLHDDGLRITYHFRDMYNQDFTLYYDYSP